LLNKGFTKTKVLPIGLDTQWFSTERDYPEPKQKRIRSFFQLLYVGIVQLKKRRKLQFLIELMDSLINRDLPVNLKIVGTGPDIEKCFNILRERGLSDRVEFIGKVKHKDLPRHYIEADCLLLPTSIEIYGMVLLEAMYFGLPVIASHAAGPDDIVSDGVDGYLMEGFNISDWAEAVLSLIYDPNKHKRMSEAAKKKIREKFTWEALAPRYAEFYQSILR
jgi:glycosyltransferase involved in cell wall biosynthesis